METWQAVAVGLIPSIGVGWLFWLAMRAVVRADRNERAALAAEDAAHASEGAGSPAQAGAAAETPPARSAE